MITPSSHVGMWVHKCWWTHQLQPHRLRTQPRQLHRPERGSTSEKHNMIRKRWGWQKEKRQILQFVSTSSPITANVTPVVRKVSGLIELSLFDVRVEGRKRRERLIDAEHVQRNQSIIFSLSDLSKQQLSVPALPVCALIKVYCECFSLRTRPPNTKSSKHTM